MKAEMNDLFSLQKQHGATLQTILSRLNAADKVQQQILALLTKTEQEFTTDMAALDDSISALQTEVANQTAVDKSAVTLLQGLATQLAAAIAAAGTAGATPAQLQALSDLQASLTANDTSLAAAVTANTPAAAPGNPPVPPVVPAPPAAKR